jgi:hypothetical protein
MIMVPLPPVMMMSTAVVMVVMPPGRLSAWCERQEGESRHDKQYKFLHINPLQPT